MLSKPIPLAVAVLLGSASAYDANDYNYWLYGGASSIGYATTLECGPCIQAGNNFCTAKATMSYYSKLSTAYTRNDATTMCCFDLAGVTCKNAAGVDVTKSADWTCYNLPSEISSSTAYTFAAKALELAACPFEETICGATREFTYDTIG